MGCAIYRTNLLLLLDFWDGIKGNFSVAVLRTEAISRWAIMPIVRREAQP